MNQFQIKDEPIYISIEKWRSSLGRRSKEERKNKRRDSRDLIENHGPNEIPVIEDLDENEA